MRQPRSRPTRGVRIGVHTSIAGRLEQAVERAAKLGCDAFQIFSASPRLWYQRTLNPVEAADFRARRRALGLAPLAIHVNYLVNLAADNPVVRTRSIQAFRAELERAMMLEADYLVVHPGSAGQQARPRALAGVAESLRLATHGLRLNGLRILLENTAGQGSALGADLDELGALVRACRELNLGVCLDTAHLFAAGYSLRTADDLERTLQAVHRAVELPRVPLIHLNDSKAALGTRVDRHEHIGKGKIGASALGRLLRHPALAGRTFILETPIDRPQDDRRNLATVRSLAAGSAGRARHP